MHDTNPISFCRLLAVSAICYFAVASSVQAQTPTPSPRQADEVVRTNIELVQTDVMVFDRRGHFVDDLRPEHFSLSLDGKKRPISLISRVTSSSKLEAAQPAVMRTGSVNSVEKSVALPKLLSDSGRLIIFFVDDVHLSAESLAHGRKALARFVTEQMGANDQVAVVSTSGRVGFLQQLTDNRTVLHAAIARLGNTRNPETYAGSTRITEYMASQIENGHDRGLFAYLMESVKLEYGMGLGSLRGDHGNDSAGQARRLLKGRISQISVQSRVDTDATLEVLRSLMQSAAGLP